MDKDFHHVIQNIVNKQYMNLLKVRENYCKEFMEFIGEKDPKVLAQKYTIIEKNISHFPSVTHVYFTLKNDVSIKPIEGFSKLIISMEQDQAWI